MKKPDFYADLMEAEKELKVAQKLVDKAEAKGHLAKLGHAWARFSEAQKRYKNLLALV